MPRIKDLTGQRFGSLVVVGYSHLNKHNRAVWKVKCDCGNDHTSDSNCLKMGLAKSCGCRGLNFTRRSVPLSERLESNITMEPNSGCWLWMGPYAANLYGRVSTGRGNGVLIHRLMYERIVGPIPDGLVLDHKCKVTLCCNPAHLRPMESHANFTLDNYLVNRTHCRNGHLVMPETILPRVGARTYRCRVCRDAARERDAARVRARRVHAKRGETIKEVG